MHPAIARFLSVDAALSVLEGGAGAASADPDSAAFWAAAEAYPEERAALLRGGRRKKLPAEAERAQIVLAIDAARRRLASDERFASRLEAVSAAFRAQGAPEDESRYLVGVAIAEEAFALDGSPDEFDAEFLLETLEELTLLARVDEGGAVGLLERFARAEAVEPTLRPLRLKVGESLLDEAWCEGSQPVTVEHVDDALEHLSDSVATSDFQRAAQCLAELIDFLAAERLVGPRRRERLLRLVESARSAEAGSLGGEDDDGDEGDDEADDAGDDVGGGAEAPAGAGVKRTVC